MPAPNQLTFAKISQANRIQEPVTVSIPFAQGTVSDPQCLVILEDDQPLRLQRRVLGRWPDGTIKWLLAHFQVDLPGNASHALRFEILDHPAPTPARAHNQVCATADKDGVLVNTGVLAFRIPAAGFLPLSEITLDGRPLWAPPSPFQGFRLRLQEQWVTTLACPVELEIEEAGPLRAVINVRGKHRTTQENDYLDLRGRVVAYAGKPYVEVEYGFFHCEDEEILDLHQVELPIHFAEPEAAQLSLGEGWYQTRIQQSTEKVELSLTADTLLYQSNEHFVECFYGDFWVDWRSDDAGLAVSLHKAHQNFPKSLRATPSGIDVGIYPAGSEPARIRQGVGKTHRLLLHFHDGNAPLDEVSFQSLQFQLPDRPALSPQWFLNHNPWELDLFPAYVPGRIMTRLIQLHDSRPEAMGMLHFGDAPDAGYTDQGRGQGSTVWVNNEYDHPHACTLFYALTGERRALEAALVAARHWLDVDLCHYSPNPLHHGGLRIHTAHHVTGGVTPSHEWVEGLLDYYYLTGRREGLESAQLVAENLLRHLERPHMRKPGAAQAREGGWALRAMVAMYQATAEERYREAMNQLVETFVAWPAQFGGMLAPYTSHTMPRVPFMIGIALNSLMRSLLVQDNAQVRELVIRTVDDLIEQCLGPDGVFYYKELPSLRRHAPTVHVIEALTHAYRLSGDQSYLKVALRQFDALLAQPIGSSRHGPKRADDGGAVIRGSGGGRIFATSYTSLIAFVASAGRAGLLDIYEYPC